MTDFLIFAATIFVLCLIAKWEGGRALSAHAVCRNCGDRVRPIHETKLSGCVLVLLLCFFIVPGLIYWAWASSQRFVRCPRCGAQTGLVHLDSPEGRRLAPELSRRLPLKEDPVVWLRQLLRGQS